MTARKTKTFVGVEENQRYMWGLREMLQTDTIKASLEFDLGT